MSKKTRHTDSELFERSVGGLHLSRSSERAIERPSDRVTERSTERSIERSSELPSERAKCAMHEWTKYKFAEHGAYLMSIRCNSETVSVERGGNH